MATFLPALRGQETQIGELPARPFDVLAIVALGLMSLPFAVRRRWPAAVLVLVSLGFVIAQLRAYHMVAGTALPIAVLNAGVHLERWRRAILAGLSVAYLGLAVALVQGLGAPERPSGFVTAYLMLALAWGAGAWLRSTRIAEAERRERVAEATRTAERTRIARELHDVVTHHVTAMVVQAEAARRLAGAPDRVDATLETIGDTGRLAITDLRHLLDVLEPDQPSVDDLHALVERTRQAGQPVEFTEEGCPPSATGTAGTVAYRVVQEALTNTLKYANGSRTVVCAHYGEREITVEVSDEGSGARGSVLGGSGRGLNGLGERVDALGGELSADRWDGGGFVVRARIPVRSVV